MQLAISLINTIPRMGLAVVPQVISSVAYFCKDCIATRKNVVLNIMFPPLVWFRYIIRSVHNYQLTM